MSIDWDILRASIVGAATGDETAQERVVDACYMHVKQLVHRDLEQDFRKRHKWIMPLFSTHDVVHEVLAAVVSLHPAIEVPDSRHEDYARVGAAQLIADVACACWFAIGPAARADWRAIDLAKHGVTVYRNGALAAQGSGANVLGDPRSALAWIANELCNYGVGLRAGEVVITGTCVTPLPVSAGDSIKADFGEIGVLEVGFV